MKTAATAASPPGRSPPHLPPPPPSSPHKPMPAGRRGGSCLAGLTSCFGGSPVADSDAGHPVDDHRRSSWFMTWSRKKKGKKKKKVPVDAPAGELSPGKKAGDDDRMPEAAGRVLDKAAAGRVSHVQNEGEKEGKRHSRRTASPAKKPPAATARSLGRRFFEKLLKGNKDKSGPRLPITGSHVAVVNKPDRSHQRQPRPPQQQQIRVAALSPKYDGGRGRAARTPPEPARTAPSRTGRTFAASATGGAPAPSSPDSPAPYCKISPPHAAGASRLGCVRSQEITPDLEPPPSLPSGRNDQLLGLSVMTVVLVMMVLFGRATAVLFTCLWLYCLPRVRATMADRQGGCSKSAGAGIDLDSGEYKKKVVLEGLLQRDGRRSPGLR